MTKNLRGTICDICILHDLPLRIKSKQYTYCCGIDMGLGILEGEYRKPAPVEFDDHNFLCTYNKCVVYNGS